MQDVYHQQYYSKAEADDLETFSKMAVHVFPENL